MAPGKWRSWAPKWLTSEKAPNRTCWKEGLEERVECLSCSVQKPNSLNDWCKPLPSCSSDGKYVPNSLSLAMYMSNKKCVIGTINRRVRAKRMQRNARYSEVLPGDQVLVQQERKNKLTTRFEPSPYTVVNKHGKSLIVQSPGGAQYYAMHLM